MSVDAPLPAAAADRRRSRSRLDPKERAIILSGQHVQQSIRPLPYVADPLLQFAKHRFAVELLPLFVEVDPLEMTGARDLALAHAASEEMTFPLRKAVAGVEAQ